MRPKIAVVFTVMLLLAAGSVMAWLAKLSCHATQSAPVADNGARLLAFIASGLAIVSLGVMAAARKHRRR